MRRLPLLNVLLATLASVVLLHACGDDEPEGAAGDGADADVVDTDADAGAADTTVDAATDASGDAAGFDALAPPDTSTPDATVTPDASDPDTATPDADADASRPDADPESPRCGDGVRNAQRTEQPVAPVAVRNPFDVEGYVCGLGGTCPSAACDVRALPSAPEHGVCQALGFERAAEVDWTGSEGANTGATPRAYNWACDDYACAAGERDTTEPACPAGVMLRAIVCVSLVDEVCDDGEDNGIAPDACRPDCTLPVCGDGITDPAYGETCDDANDIPDDGCNRCVAPSCGDAVVQTTEACDDGNDDNTDDCTDACERPACGDGFVQPSNAEECDDGAANSDRPDACRNDCRRARCGDLVIDTGETCDDGNQVGGDGCSARCDLE